MSPSEAKSKHMATDLLKWAQRFEDELNEFHREDYGIARVAYEVYELRSTLAAIFGSKLPHQKIKDFIPTFTAEEPQKSISELSEEDHEAKIKEISEASRAKWFAGLGLDESGKPRNPVQPHPQLPQDTSLKPQERPSNTSIPLGLGQTPTNQKTRRIITPGGD